MFFDGTYIDLSNLQGQYEFDSEDVYIDEELTGSWSEVKKCLSERQAQIDTLEGLIAYKKSSINQAEKACRPDMPAF